MDRRAEIVNKRKEPEIIRKKKANALALKNKKVTKNQIAGTVEKKSNIVLNSGKQSPSSVCNTNQINSKRNHFRPGNHKELNPESRERSSVKGSSYKKQKFRSKDKEPSFSKKPNSKSSSSEKCATVPSTHPQACVVCRDAACLRMSLRDCQHIVCVACLLGYLQGQIALKAKVGIRCPSGYCSKEIHENDIRAIFDEKEPGLDVFMSPARRQWLQYCHDKDSVVLGLAGPNPRNQDELTRRCPLCKNIYYKRLGCHNVVCPNLRCKTNFCWTCGKPIRGIGHFAGGKCRVAFDDIMRSSVVMSLLSEIHTFVFILSYPISFTFCYIVLPLLVLFGFAYYSALRVYRAGTRFTDFLTYWEWISMGPQMVISAGFGLLIGFPVAVLSIFTGASFFILYNVIVALKFTGLLNKAIKKHDKMLPMASLLGLSHIKEMLKEGREEKKYEKERRAAEKEREQLIKANVLNEVTPPE